MLAISAASISLTSFNSIDSLFPITWHSCSIIIAYMKKMVLKNWNSLSTPINRMNCLRRLNIRFTHAFSLFRLAWWFAIKRNHTENFRFSKLFRTNIPLFGIWSKIVQWYIRGKKFNLIKNMWCDITCVSTNVWNFRLKCGEIPCNSKTQAFMGKKPNTKYIYTYNTWIFMPNNLDI